MAIVQLDYVPTYGSSSSVTPRVKLVRFGDGYVQRGADGINLFPDTWSLSFENVTDEVASSIEGILKEAAGGTVQWKPAPAELADPYRNFICLSWSRTRNNYNSQTVKMELEEVFE